MTFFLLKMKKLKTTPTKASSPNTGFAAPNRTTKKVIVQRKSELTVKRMRHIISLPL